LIFDNDDIGMLVQLDHLLFIRKSIPNSQQKYSDNELCSLIRLDQEHRGRTEYSLTIVCYKFIAAVIPRVHENIVHKVKLLCMHKKLKLNIVSDKN